MGDPIIEAAEREGRDGGLPIANPLFETGSRKPWFNSHHIKSNVMDYEASFAAVHDFLDLYALSC